MTENSTSLLSGEENEAEERLREKLVPIYWTSAVTKMKTYGVCKDQSFSGGWFTHSVRTNVMPEHIVIIETIWLLKGFTESKVYKLHNDKMIVDSDVTLKFVGQDVTQDILAVFCEHGNILRKLHTFVKVTSQTYPGAFVDGRPSVHALLAGILQKHLQVFNEKLDELLTHTMESVHNGRSYGLLRILEQLYGDFRDLQFLGEVFVTAVEPFSAEKASTKFLEYVLLDFLLQKFKSIWKTRDLKFGKIVFEIINLVTVRHGELFLLTDVLTTEKNMFVDLMQRVNVNDDEKESSSTTTKRGATSSVPKINAATPLLQQHFTALRNEAFKPEYFLLNNRW